MDFSFSEEQRLLRDSLTNFLRDRYDADPRRKAIASDAGWRPELWKALAEEVGVLGAALPEELGGLGGGPVDTMVVMTEFGRALVVEPFLETVVIGAGLLKRFDSPAARDAVEQIIAGELITTLAWGEPTSRYDVADVSHPGPPRGRGMATRRPEGGGVGGALGVEAARHGAHGRRAARRRGRVAVPGRQGCPGPCHARLSDGRRSPGLGDHL